MIDSIVKPNESLAVSAVFENKINRKRPLWNANAVAEFLGVSERTVRDWVYKRIIPFRKAGYALRFAPEEIEQWTLPTKE